MGVVGLLYGIKRWMYRGGRPGRLARAADGEAVLRRDHGEPVRLQEVDVAERPPIIRRYLDLAPGARPHVPVSRTAPIAEFERP